MIALVNGPWDKHNITDAGTVQIKMTISQKWKVDRPAVGAEGGYAIYEPNEERTHAFWLTNVWNGITQKIIDEHTTRTD